MHFRPSTFLLERKGHSKNNMAGPYVVGWFLEDPKNTRAGQIFFRDFFVVFFNSPHRETPKNVIKKIEKTSVLDFFVDLKKLLDTEKTPSLFFTSLIHSLAGLSAELTEAGTR
jgi:hypothetical protein